MIDVIRYLRNNDFTFLNYINLRALYNHLQESEFARKTFVSYSIQYMHVVDMDGVINYYYFDLDKNNINRNTFCFV